MTVKTVPPGSIVIVGQGFPPLPQLRFWLAVISMAVCECAVVSVPEAAGDTVMVWSGSPETVTVQLTVPPDALRNSSAPRPPGTRKSEPPPGNTRSVPAGWLGGGVAEGLSVTVGVAGGDTLGVAVVGTDAGVVVMAAWVTVTAVGVVARADGDRRDADAAGALVGPAAVVVMAAGVADDTGGLGSAAGLRCS